MPEGLSKIGRWVIGGMLLLLGVSWAAGPSFAEVSIEVFYAPEDLPGERLVHLYNQATHSIYVAMYSLTFPPAVEALISAKKRGVDVRVLTDRERANDPKQRMALDTLRLAGIPVRINQHDALMHLKQVVVDEDVNTSGSMNMTTSGHRYNDERLDVITDRATTLRAKQKFLSLWNDHIRFHPWEPMP